MRINQYLARCGVCSRRAADNLINTGVVAVDGAVATLGMDVNESSIVTVNNERITLPSKYVVLAYNKPVGVTCSEKDVHAKRLVTREIQSDRRLTYAGRLDKDSEGLLIMTDDGELINSMMKGANFHEKEYVVTVNKSLNDNDLAQMAAGVFLKELEVRTRPCSIEKVSDSTFRIVLTQGLNRQIRRMCEAYNYEVTSLKRVRIMNVTLGNLQVGASRELSEEELKELYKRCKLPQYKN